MDQAELTAIAREATERIVDALAASETLPTPEPLSRPDDEADLRRATLRRVKAGQVTGQLLAEVAAEFTAQEAATAVWLGASLADLGSASGSTRQAARKRWPDLGQIYRVRRWLYGYRADILHIVELLFAAFPEETVAALRAGLPTDGEVHWRSFGEFVDQQVRTVIEQAEATTDEQRFALDAGIGLLAHYDSVAATTATTS